MSEFKAIETQEDLDKIIENRLARQKESIEGKYADYDKLQAKNTELETTVGTLQKTVEDSNKSTAANEKTVSDLNAKVAGYETASLRTRIALQNGLPYDLADRLIGDDEESIKSDAERLASLVKTQEPVPPLKSTEEPLDKGEDGAYKSLIENLNLEGE